MRDNAKEIMKSGVQVGGTQGAANAASNEPVKYSDFLHLPHGLDGYFDYDQALKYADLALQADARLVASLQAKFGTGNVKVVEKSIEKRA